MIQLKENNLNKIILIGDRVLVKPTKPSPRTESGLYLPQGMHKKEELYSGYIMKVGPGYPIPAIQDDDETWKEKVDGVKYVPIQPKPGDLAVYLQKSVFAIEFNLETYVIVPYSALLLLVRDSEME